MNNNFLDDPTLLEKSRIYNEEHNRQKWRTVRTNNRKEGARKGVKTRKSNQFVKLLAEEQLAKARAAEISFLPPEYQDPCKPISVSDLMQLHRQFPDPKHINIINRLYDERKSGSIKKL